MTESELESRLRVGLRAAGEALPPAAPESSPQGGPPDGPFHHRRGRRTWLAAAAAAIVVVAATGVGVAALGGDGDGGDDDPADVEVAQTPSTDTTVPDPGPAVDPIPGTAVVAGTELVSFGPDGQPGERLSLAPLSEVHDVVSDRDGGWIACGSTTVASPSDQGPQHVYWYRPGHVAQALAVRPTCVPDSLGVTEVDGNEVLVYLGKADLSVGRRDPLPQVFDLTTGADSPVPVDLQPAANVANVAVGGGRLATMGDTGLVVTDLATGAAVPTGRVDLPVRPPGAASGMLTGDLALSPDGTRLAALVGDISASSEIVVVDLASGAELFRQAVPMSLEGASLAFDGTTVAAGNYSDLYGPVRIYDLATGAERTVEAHGILP
jgi:hypothetical protein